jgi:predicted dehydrogenase
MLTDMRSKDEHVRTGVIGVGSMGQHHARVFSQLSGADFVGVYDVDSARARDVCRRFGGTVFGRLEGLLNEIQAVTIAAPTTLHWEIGRQCIERGIHVLMEKPLAHDLELSERLVDLAGDRGTTLMVGHIERYNPAIAALLDMLVSEPEPILSIDARRLSPFDGSRCLDVDVLHDLLIHDVDLALEVADSEIVDVSAVGKSVYSSQADMSHVRAIFAGGTVATFTTAKCCPKKMRSFTVSTPSRFFEADTLTRTLTVFKARELPDLESGACYMGDVHCEVLRHPDVEPLRRELEDFVRSIQEGRPPIVDGRRGLRALSALHLIANSLRRRSNTGLSS